MEKYVHQFRYEIFEQPGWPQWCVTVPLPPQCCNTITRKKNNKSVGNKFSQLKSNRHNLSWSECRALWENKGSWIVCSVFSVWNISFLSINTFSVEDLIKRVWVCLRRLGSSSIIKQSQRVKQHATKYTAHISVLWVFAMWIICPHVLIYELCKPTHSCLMLMQSVSQIRSLSRNEHKYSVKFLQ